MEMRLPQLLILAVVAVAIVVVAAILLPRMLGQSREQDLLATGTAAHARVVELAKTGISRGPNTPLVRITLEVQPAPGGGEPFRAELELGVSVVDLPKVQPGLTVPVRYDPNDRKRVAIVF